jgi:hypothetical protein
MTRELIGIAAAFAALWAHLSPASRQTTAVEVALIANSSDATIALLDVATRSIIGKIDVNPARVKASGPGAANYAQDVKDIGLTVTATNVKPTPTTREVEVHVVIAPTRLTLTDAGDRKKGSIDIAIFCAGDRERLIGQTWNTVEFEMTPEAVARFNEKGMTYSGRVPVTMDAKHVKVIVYDPGADLVGSVVVKIK